MNPGGPSTPQRIFPVNQMGTPNQMASQSIRPAIPPQNPALFNNRSYSPQTPSMGPVPQQMIRTPMAMMQQSPGMPNTVKRHSIQLNPGVIQQPMTSASQSSLVAMQNEALARTQNRQIKKKGKLKDKIISQKVRDLVPESQSYMDLLAFERKLDATIMRKRLDIQEALKKPIKNKKKLRIFITNQYYPGKTDGETDDDGIPQWELKIEGRLMEEAKSETASKVKPRKFSSFFKSLVIELDKDLYGPDNHLVEWHRTPQTAETDGFQVKRHGDQSLKCTILMLLDYQPPQFKLDSRLAKILGIHTATRPVIIQSLWQYIKNHKLQDSQEKEYINLDKYLQQIFESERIRFSDIPSKLHMHCTPPDPIVINHMINIEANEPKRTSIYDIEVEMDDSIRDQMKLFLSTSQTQSLAEINQLDTKINELIEQLNQFKISREFFANFADDPQDFIHKWLVSQSNDLKTMLDLSGNPEEERRSQFFQESWTDEAVSRYFYNKIQQRRGELEQALGIKG
ncbi:Smarcd1 [Brachionus plicatilis]|uniref:Smarcd1 n=1 Tax=Brachionus plicatilis TaxID=10195 RepID=A0A3M7RM12_BRAPC|nr:Smarcd1 [Brachionus plicatilis]